MEFRSDRFAFGLLVLLFCAIAAWRGTDQTPSRVVVELVSVVFKPARIVAHEPLPIEAKAAGEWESIQTAAPTQETSAAVQKAKAVLKQRSAVVSSPRTSVAASKVPKISCRPPACRARAEHAAVPQSRKPEPPLPSVFVPIRNLGLYLQARMGAPQHGKTAEKRKR
jgi:hypothetical protein